MPNYHINLNPQISEWSAPSAADANGSIVAVLCERGLPAWSVTDSNVTSPNPVTMDIKAGALEQDHHVYLTATTGAQYWKFTITLGDVYRTWYFTWDNTAHTDFADLDFIDPYSYEGA